MIEYDDETLFEFYDKEQFLNDYITEEHKNIQVLTFMDDINFDCPYCGAGEEFTDNIEEDNKTYLYCSECDSLIARYIDQVEYRYKELIEEGKDINYIRAEKVDEMKYKKYRIVETTYSDDNNGFRVGHIIEGKLYKNKEIIDDRNKNYRADIVVLKNSDYFFFRKHLEEYKED